MSNKNVLDQYYTKNDVAKLCYDNMMEYLKSEMVNIKLMVEPSAGCGSFYNIIKKYKKTGLDIEPKCAGVIKKNFFDFTCNKSIGNAIITIGNPPFGKNSSLAVKFFNHAATYSDYICFILPKTFRKESIHNKLNKSFHLIIDNDLPRKSFLLNGEEYDVPCCFQIWKRKKEERVLNKNSRIYNDIFDFVKKFDSPDLAVRRVGGRTGKCKVDIDNANINTHYFLKLKDNNKCSLHAIIDIIDNLDIKHIINNTAGVKSLSKGELLLLISKKLESLNI